MSLNSTKIPKFKLTRSFSAVNRWSFNLHGFTSIYDALEIVNSGLNFRPGSVKTIISLLDNVEVVYDRYGDALTTLRQNQLTLHLLTRRQISAAIEKSGEIPLGFDSETTFYRRRLPDDGGAAVNNARTMSKTIEQTLALESGGSVFNLAMTAENRANAESFANRVSTVEEPICESCYCLARVDGQGTFKCHRCIQ